MTERLTIWWRDDDAVSSSPALQRLLAIKRRWAIPLALSVIPMRVDMTLASAIQEVQNLDVLVHGYAHANNAAPGSHKAEFAAGREVPAMRAELAQGLGALRVVVPHCLPVFVPPWNQIPTELWPELTAAGYRGLSAWGAEDRWPKLPSLVIANAHIDVIAWREGGRPKTTAELIDELSAILASGRHANGRPIGVLTHHLQMPDAAFANLEGFFGHIAQDERFVWTAARRIFLAAKTEDETGVG
jgi:hypothetical protein